MYVYMRQSRMLFPNKVVEEEWENGINDHQRTLFKKR